MNPMRFSLRDLKVELGMSTPGGRPHTPERRRADRRLLVRIMGALLLGECATGNACGQCLPCRVAGALGPLLRREVARTLKEAARHD